MTLAIARRPAGSGPIAIDSRSLPPPRGPEPRQEPPRLPIGLGAVPRRMLMTDLPWCSRTYENSRYRKCCTPTSSQRLPISGLPEGGGRVAKLKTALDPGKVVIARWRERLRVMVVHRIALRHDRRRVRPRAACAAPPRPAPRRRRQCPHRCRWHTRRPLR
jgi:hypothetical protein